MEFISVLFFSSYFLPSYFFRHIISHPNINILFFSYYPVSYTFPTISNFQLRFLKLSRPLNATHSSALSVSKWLEELEGYRNLVADDLFADQDELRLLWTFIISLKNSVEFAKGKEIQICDPTRLLVCNNDTKCGCQTDDNLYSPLNKLSSSYDPQLGACVLITGVDCPAAPTSIMCEVGAACLTEVGLRPCTIENLSEDLFSDTFSHRFLGGFSLELNSSIKGSIGRASFETIDYQYNGKFNHSRVKSRRGKKRSHVGKVRSRRASPLDRYSLASMITQNYHCTCYGGYEGGGAMGLSIRFMLLVLSTFISCNSIL